MKFSEITSGQWEELSPYLDTCLLPVTGMTGGEKPFEATEKLERLRDMMDLIEIPFKGRVVTYPAWHYISGRESNRGAIEDWCSSMRHAGFRYIVVVTSDPSLYYESSHIDLWFKTESDGSRPSQAEVSEAIRALWSGQAT